MGSTTSRTLRTACTKFPVWRVSAVEASLYRVERTGKDVPSAEAERIALDGLLLQPTWSLDEADIKSGTCVLVRKAVGAAASGACACLSTSLTHFSRSFASLARSSCLHPPSRACRQCRGLCGCGWQWCVCVGWA